MQKSLLWINFIVAVLWVSGTCIGGGMLALPVSTGMIGFVPSFFMLLLSWLFMTATGLLILEASLWFEEETHMITMSSRLLGKWGKGAVWILYLFIAYGSLVAYISGGGAQITEGAKELCRLNLTNWQGALIFSLIWGSVLLLGKNLTGKVNGLLVICMIAAYIGVICFGSGGVQTSLLLHTYWKKSLFAIPILLTVFSFQGIVPSLRSYLKEKPNLIRWAIICGTSIAVLVYVSWQVIVLGTIPASGENGLISAFEQGKDVTLFLKYFTENVWFSRLALYFAYLAIVTSFLGIGLGLFDFLADGFKISKKGMGNLWLILIIMLPSFYFAVSYSRIFLVAMELSGGLGDSILNGILPALMVWVGRYSLKLKSERPFPGGKLSLSGIIISSIFIFLLTVWKTFVEY